MAEKRVEVPIVLHLKPADYQKLTESKDNPKEVFETWASWFLTQYAAGGFMLQAQHLEAIREFAKDPVLEPAAVVRLCKAGIGVGEQGGLEFKVNLDPAFAGTMRERAKEMGVDLQYLLTDAFNTAMQNGWLYEVGMGLAATANFTEEEHKFLAEVIGKQQFFGSDIVAAVRKLVAEKS